MEVASIINRDSLSATIGTESFNIPSSHPKFEDIRRALLDGTPGEEILPMFQTAKAVVDYTDGAIEIRGGKVFFANEEVGGSVVDRILEFMSEKLPNKPLFRFLERVMRNPSMRSREQLYDFLEHKNLPLTTDGKFLAYKSVSSGYMDHHTGKISNKIGSVIAMPRHRISDDPSLGCHTGLHVGALQYAADFGGSDRKVVICEIDPEHVVSVPLDCECQKMRVCQYRVVADYTGPIERSLVEDYDNEESYDEDEVTSTN